MATTSSDVPPSTATPPAAQPASGSRPTSREHAARPASPVEMKPLPASDPLITNPAETSTDAQSADPTAVVSTTSKPAAPADLSRTETEAIGPSTDTPAANPDNTNGPVVVIMLLLTTGARHPYKIDEKYLKKRNVTVEDMDPYNISVYTLKELIWRDWREEWEPRPTTPSSIRLIHFGRMLEDKIPLKECRFQSETPNVVHMTVKPQEVVDEEDAKGGKGGSRRDTDEEATAGCRCVIL
ncbi:unnamed protein product [Periconia digitata]|uniref:UBL3-like ubiquitin domain-containing protein n=1 Tax=Periconia digitata TaxID=1303443 RepID=A0A9W4U4I6_9PLEO|nr:unnamed protein product [Periconia digitata]